MSDSPKVRCRACNTVLTLTPDSPEARENRSDPLQQMRRHIVSAHSLKEIRQHARKCGFLIDMLFFDAVNNHDKWKKNFDNMIEYLLREPFNG